MNDPSFSHELLGLLPQPRESVLSWLSRLCIGYGEAPSGINKYLGVKIGDCFETNVSKFSTDQISSITGYPTAIFELSRRVTSNIQKMNVDKNLYMYATVGPNLRFKFCPKCLQYDPIPNFKVDWSLDFVRFCFIHKCLLEIKCPHCLSEVYLPYRVIDSSRKDIEIISLAQCQVCGEILYKVTPVMCKKIALCPSGSEQLDHLRNGMAVMASLVYGYGKSRQDGRKISLMQVGNFIKSGLCPNLHFDLDPSVFRGENLGVRHAGAARLSLANRRFSRD